MPRKAGVMLTTTDTLILPWWETMEDPIRGFEDDDPDEGEETEEEDEGEEDEEEEEEDEGEAESAALRKSLQAERKLRRETQKALKKMERETAASSQKGRTDLEKATERADKAEAQAARLAAQVRRTAEDRVIAKFTKDFIDPDDVLSMIDRSKFEVDQDEDDPNDIHIDEKSVEVAVKKFAKAKSHLLKEGEEEDRPSADLPSGTPRGSKRRGKQSMTNDQYKELYPALQT